MANAESYIPYATRRDPDMIEIPRSHVPDWVKITPRPARKGKRGAGGEEAKVAFPKVVKVRRGFPRPRVENIEAALREQLARDEIASRVSPGMRVALTAGS